MVSFNPKEHFDETCRSIQLTNIKHSDVTYQLGWANLVAELLKDLKSYKIERIYIEDSFGQLDVNFESNQRKGELAIWRLINSYKYKSRSICMICGDNSCRIYTVNHNKRFCRDCQKLNGKNGNTGTWLDKYN